MAFEYQPASSPKPPEPDPEINTSKRYDVYCVEPIRGTVVFRNARFKGTASLLPDAGGRNLSNFVELEQANGQSIFVARSSIFRLCEPGATIVAEVVTPNKQDVR